MKNVKCKIKLKKPKFLIFNFQFLISHHKAVRGQGMIESMLITVLFLSAIVFVMVQFSLITFGWLRANDAAQAGVRCAIVAKGISASSEAENAAQTGILYVLGAGLPAKATVWEKNLGDAKDHAGSAVRMFSAHAYYIQKIMFSSILQPFLGENDPFIKTGGMAGSFYGGGFGMLDVSRKYGITGAAHCRMVKSPDCDYYDKAYKGAKKFNE